MRWRILFAMMLCSPGMAPVPAFSFSPERRSDGAGGVVQPDRAIIEAEARWMTAMRVRDAATLEMMMAPDFTLAGVAASERPPVPRAAWIDNALNHLRLDTALVEDPQVEVRGADAIVRATITWAGSYDGEAFRESVPVIDVWRRDGARWRVVSRRVGEPLAG